MSVRRTACAFVLTSLLAACGGGNAASRFATPPAFEPAGQTKCKAAKSQSEPLVVEWPSAARAKVEALARGGMIAVRYGGCELEVLDRCAVKEGRYSYTGITPKRDRVTIQDEDALYANMPLGAAKLEGTLASAGELDVNMTIVGRWAADRKIVGADQIEGPDCAKATHVVSALTVGAFDFYAGAEAEVSGAAGFAGAGGGASSKAERRLLDSDGRLESCDKATTSDAQPPEGCGGVVRLELAPLGENVQPTRAEPPRPTSPQGEELRFTAADKDQSFTVSVEAGGVTKACDRPVTYYDECKISGLPAGRATMHVGGDASLDRDMRIADSGTAEVKLSHRGHGAEIGLGIFSLGMGGLLAYGLADSSFLGDVHDKTLDIVWVTLGGSLLLITLPGALAAALGPHDYASVERKTGDSEVLTSGIERPHLRFGAAPAPGGATAGALVTW